MAVTLEITPRHIFLRGDVDASYLRALDKRTSYLIQGFRFTPRFRSGMWDGREHLLVYSAKDKLYRLPTGMLDDAIAAAALTETEIEIDDRVPEPTRVQYAWNDEVVLRPHQESAVQAMLRARCGTLKMGTGGGKTITAAALIQRRGVRSLFVVTSLLLLRQARRELARCLPGTEVGIVGEGQWQVANVTVATAQTLALHARDLSESKFFGLMIFDEAHRAFAAPGWRRTVLGIPVTYRYGLSATVYPEAQSEIDRGALWLKAVCGPIVHEVSASDLIDADMLVPLEIRLYRVSEPDMRSRPWSPTIPDECVHQSAYRNARAARIAADMVREEGMRVLVVSRRHAQVRSLYALLTGLGIRTAVVTGLTPRDERDAAVAALRARELDCIVGTVMGEGVDIPELEGVVVAEAGKDRKAALQRARNLRKSPGKTRAVLVDFMDLTHPILAAHSAARLAAYKSERAFRIKLVE